MFAIALGGVWHLALGEPCHPHCLWNVDNGKECNGKECNGKENIKEWFWKTTAEGSAASYGYAIKIIFVGGITYYPVGDAMHDLRQSNVFRQILPLFF